MPNRTKEQIFAEAISSVTTKQLSWRYEDEPIIVELPDDLIHANKISVLDPFIKEFKKNVAYQSRIRLIKELLVPCLSKISQIDSAFVSFSEEISKIEVIILLSNRKYDRKLAEKLFDIRLVIEDKYTNYQVDFLEIPRFDKKDEDVVSRAFVKIYP